MTIPSRPAPPPPQAASNKVTRYSPATNWDDTPFNPQTNGGSSSRQAPMMGKKAPPPRPPPPKVVPALKKPGQAQSINILSNLFGQKRGSGGASKSSTAQKGVVPMKLPPPPKLPPPLGGGGHHHQAAGGSHYGSIGGATFGSGPANGTDSQLISFDSPPSSPTFTQKSCSDCISVDSFSSDSNYSSPNNGNMSQAESGFEDDFVSQNEHFRSKTNTPSGTLVSTPASGAAMKDLWDLSDPFGMPPPVSTKPFASSSSSNQANSIYAPLSSATIRAPAVNSKLYDPEFVDPLCNGKTVAPKVQTVAMPTIIKAAAGSSTSSNSQRSTPMHKPTLAAKPTILQPPPLWSTAPAAAPKPIVPAMVPSVFPNSASSFPLDDEDDAEEALDSLPSPPMPNIPPPPPPPCLGENDDDEYLQAALGSGLDLEERKEPYGVALYDFSGETDEDLSFRMNDKIYLLKRLNDEWLYGRDRRGCEGMFPVNYIEVKVPLAAAEERLPSSAASSASTAPAAVNCKNSNSSCAGDISHSAGIDSFSSSTSSKVHPTTKVRVLYTFNAETAEDLTIVENDFVTVLAQITPEWLYGELHGQRGQFPANFVEYVPPNLPPMASGSGI